MDKTILYVDGMSCDHCVRAVTNAVGALPGVAGVSVDLKNKTVTVEYDPVMVTLDKIRFEIEDQGYDIVG